jgi:hypothetical protein
LPNENVEYQVPEKVLASRMKKVDDVEVAQVLIKWSQMSAELATWKDKVILMQQFLAAPAWGQAGHQDRGGVSSVRVTDGKRVKRVNVKCFGPEWTV